MERLAVFAAIGFVAQLVDGSLGMGYGVTSASLLLGAGISPLTASASIHLAELGTNLVSGASHARFGNVDWSVVKAIALPGAAGAFVGAYGLAQVDGEAVAPFIAAFLFGLGAFVLARFTLAATPTGRPHPSRRRLGGIGLVGGFADAVGGGGWGPIATPSLLATGSLAPRMVVGSVNAAEFVVTLAASLGFLVALASGSIDFGLALALLLGGAVVAPFAAMVVRRLPARVLGTAVGGMILLTNTRTVGEALGASGPVLWAIYLVIVALTAAALIYVRRALLSEPCLPRV